MNQREIKFRAWWESAKAFHHFGIEGTTLTNCPFMQFTGFKDKNGTEIYEGDILLFYMRLAGGVGKPKHVKTELVGEVRWDSDDASYWLHMPFKPDPKITAHFTGFFRSNAEEGEVIGNIYENPELMTKK